MRTWFSIRYKFLLATTALLATCVGSYLLLATNEFKKDKRTLVFDYNLSLVSNISSDLESFFSSLSDKTKVIAFYSRESESARKKLIGELMQNQNDLVFVAGSEQFHGLSQTYYLDESYLKTYGVDTEFLKGTLFEKRAIPFEKIQTDGQAIWNATIQYGPPLIGIGRSVIEEDSAGIPVRQYAVVGLVRADRIIKSLEQGRPNEVYVMGKTGELLVHPDVEKMAQAGVESEFKNGSLSKLAAKSEVRKSVAEFALKAQKYLGAYAKTMGGQLVVLSQVSESAAFQAVDRLILRSLLFASMIVTLAFLVAIFFSRSLTQPIDTLMSGMSRVATGDLSTHIQVQSRDEISSLAESFNSMIADLRKSRSELEEINRELENKVRERTDQLEKQNQAVKEAQEALLRTTRLAAVGEVAGQAAHEVLNPLTSIISRLDKVHERLTGPQSTQSQLLLEIKKSWEKDFSEGGFSKLVQVWQTPSTVNKGQNLWDEDIANMEQIGQNYLTELKQISEDLLFLKTESERIGRIISSFRSLGLARGEAKEHSVHDLCERSTKIMADLAEKDQIRISLDKNATDDRIAIDGDEFIQVMTNLIRNALQSVRHKHQGLKTGELKIYTQNVDGRLQIHILDNGTGIKEEHKARLFEKNFTTKSRTEGTGIGLSISRRLIRAYHGDLILVQSDGVSGAQFMIDLPLIASQISQQKGVA